MIKKINLSLVVGLTLSSTMSTQVFANGGRGEFHHLPKDLRHYLFTFLDSSGLEALRGVNNICKYDTGKISFPILLKELENSDPLVREKAASSLRGYHGPGAQQLFEKALTDSEVNVRRNAARSLRGYHGPGAMQLLNTALSDIGSNVRFSGTEALRDYYGHGAQELFEKALSDSEILIRLNATEAQVAHKAKIAATIQPSAASTFWQDLSNTDWTVRAAAAKGLKNYHGLDARERFEIALIDSEENVRKIVAEALEDYYGPGLQQLLEKAGTKRTYINQIDEKLNNVHAGIRLKAVLALEHLNIDTDTHKLFEKALRDAHFGIRLRAVLALKKLSSPSTLTLLKIAQDDSNIKVRAAATEVKSFIIESIYQQIVEQLNDKDPSQRKMAALAIGALLIVEDQRAFQLFERALGDLNEDVRVSAVMSLQCTGKDPESLRLLERAQSDESPKVRAAAAADTNCSIM